MNTYFGDPEINILTNQPINDMKLISVKTILGLSGLLLMAACTNELVDSAADGARAISFTSAAETRAAVEGNALPADFKVWGGYDGNAVNVFNGETVQYPNWTYTGGTQYWIPGKTYNFYGVYPVSVNASCASDGTLTVSDFDCSKTGDDAVDLMTASQTGISYAAGVTPQSVDMQFGHELARVKFTVESENTVVSVTKCKVYGVNYQGTLSKKDASAWTELATNTENDGIFNASAFSLNATEGLSRDVFGDMLLLPLDATQLEGAKLAFAYRYSDETTDRTSTIDLKNTSVQAWEAGQSYHYKLTIKGGTLTVTVKVVDWKEEDTSVSWG